MIYKAKSRNARLIKRRSEFIDESEQYVISSIKTHGAHIERSVKNNYRPYLMLYGEITDIAFPNGVYQKFIPKTQVHVRYEFSDDELAQLASKGLFYDGFKCPEIISENPGIEIPMKAVARRYAAMGNTYVTLDIDSSNIFTTNTENCGYTLADYFETQIPSKLETEFVPEEDGIPVFDDDFIKQFNNEFDEFEENTHEHSQEQEQNINEEQAAMEIIKQAEKKEKSTPAYRMAKKLLAGSTAVKREQYKLNADMKQKSDTKTEIKMNDDSNIKTDINDIIDKIDDEDTIETNDVPDTKASLKNNTESNESEIIDNFINDVDVEETKNDEDIKKDDVETFDTNNFNEFDDKAELIDENVKDNHFDDKAELIDENAKDNHFDDKAELIDENAEDNHFDEIEDETKFDNEFESSLHEEAFENMPFGIEDSDDVDEMDNEIKIDAPKTLFDKIQEDFSERFEEEYANSQNNNDKGFDDDDIGFVGNQTNMNTQLNDIIMDGESDSDIKPEFQ